MQYRSIVDTLLVGDTVCVGYSCNRVRYYDTANLLSDFLGLKVIRYIAARCVTGKKTREREKNNVHASPSSGAKSAAIIRCFK